MNDSNHESSSSSIAIIGMAGRFPNARTIEEFWLNLRAGKESIRQLTDEELAGVELDFDEIKDDPAYVRARGMLDDIDMFDASFFGLNPRQARALDPQQRVWLETAWQALERAGYAPEKYDGSIGVFAGEYLNGYLYYNLLQDRDTIEKQLRFRSIDAFLNLISNDKDYLPSRTSFLFNLTGPSVNVQSACSTSLVSVAMACQNLLHYESDICLAGGVSISVPQEKGYFYQEGGIVSPDGHCRPFDAKAAGTVFSSGVGVVVLKRLEDALEDGDNILAVIKGSALNNDGAVKASYTAPSVDGQAEVIAMAQAMAGVEPESISYVEGHGTATPLGDPIEVAGLTKAFRLQTEAKQFCGLGSVKSNVGHLDAASGVAGLIKTVLALQHEEIPPTLHFTAPNPEIDFENSPFYVVNQLTPWKKGHTPRRAGVSSFGVGGTNVHVIVEEAPHVRAPLAGALAGARPRHLLMLSAKTKSALATQATNLATSLVVRASALQGSAKAPLVVRTPALQGSARALTTSGSARALTTSELADVAFTLQVGRTDMPYRRIVVAANIEQAVARLSESKADGTLPPEGAITRLTTDRDPEVVFMFPGQGSQHVNMGRELYENEPIFRETIDKCADILLPLLELDLREVLYPTDSELPSHYWGGPGGGLNQTGIAQPAIFTVEYALAQLWMAWGIQPSAMVGHSVGEYTAACLAGVFSLEDALTVLAARARLMQEMPGGSMRAVRLSEQELQPFLGHGVSLAACNAPSICIVSGPTEAIDAFDERMAAQERSTIRLHTSHAFHSSMMDPVLEPFSKIVASVELRAPQIPIISTLTGRWVSEANDALPSEQEMSDPTYWTQQLRQAVRFSDAVQLLQEQPGRVLLEVGPSKSLSTSALQHVNPASPRVPPKFGRDGWTVIDSLGHVKRQIPALERMLEALGRLWMAGVSIDWQAFYEGQRGQRVVLPTYPFERKRYWVEPPPLPREPSPPGRVSQLWEKGRFKNINLSPPGTQGDNINMNHQTHNAYHEAKLQEARMNRKNRIMEKLAGIMYDLSGIEIGADAYHATFMEMGLDSLTLTQVSTVLKKQLGVSIKFRKLLEDVSTLDLLADYMAQKLPADAFAVVAPAPVTPAPVAAPVTAPPHPPSPPLPQGEGGMMARPLASPTPFSPGERGARGVRGAVNGNGSAMQTLIQQQIQLMSQQLQLLGKMPTMPQQPAVAPTAAVEAPVAPAPAPAPAPFERATASSKSNRPKAPKSAKPKVYKPGFGPYHPVDKAEDGGLTYEQRQYLDSLIARLSKRTQKSKQIAQDYRVAHADPRSVANFRKLWKELIYQIVMDGSSGSRMWDVDGNEYVDITLGFGVNFLGHSPDFVTKAVKAQLEKGVEIAPQSPLAGEVADLICELTGLERVAFSNTGSEAVLATVRVARTVTARDKIVSFAGDYHGLFDEMLARPQIMRGELHTMPAAPGIMQDAVNNLYLLDYGEEESLDFIRQHADELAAVLIEPIQSRHPYKRPLEFVRQVREITAQHGIAMIFDEVITGFRVHQQGAQAIYGVQPDLAAYGKIVGGGMPIGVVAGKAAFMDAIDGGYWQFGDNSQPEADLTFFAGTFVRHPLALAASKASLEFLKEQGPQLQEGVNQRTTAMVNQLNRFFEESKVPIRIRHFSSWFRFDYPSDLTYATLLFYAMLEKGLYIREGGQNCFISIAHTDEDIAFVIQVIKESVGDLQRAGFLPGKPLPHGDGNGGEAQYTTPPRPLAPSPLSFAGGRFSLTEAQTEIWLAIQLDEAASCAYNEILTMHFEGPLDVEKLNKAVHIVIGRHEALNVKFSPDGSYQEVVPNQEIEMVLKSVTAGEALYVSQDAQVAELLATEASTPFDLINGPLVRVKLLKLAENEHLFVFSSHHIVYDGWSTSILLSELSEVYNALCEGRAYGLAAPSQFSEYAAELLAEADSEEVIEARGTTPCNGHDTLPSEARDYWRELFAEVPPVLELPTDRPRPAMKSYQGESYKRVIKREVYQAIKRTAAEQNVTLFVTLFSAYNVFLSRLSGQQDIVVGIASAGQAMTGHTNLIGHCVNLLPLRTQMESKEAFNDLLKRTKSTVLDAYDHYQSTFGSILRDLKLPRDPSRLPLVEVLFNLDKDGEAPRFYGLQTKIAQAPKQAANFDLFFNINEIEKELVIDCNYRSSLFDETTIKRWLGHFENLLAGIAAQPNRPISELPLLSEAEKEQILLEWNDTKQPYPQDACLHHLFEAQVERTPEATAIIFEDQALTYQALNQRANQLAHYLIDFAPAIRPGDLVGISVERSFDMVVGLLGILKAGAAYVPLDPAYPLARLSFMLDDTQVKVLLTQQAFVDNLDDLGSHQTLSLDTEWWRIAQQPKHNPITTVKSDDLAYLIYTSGSTGKPKGVQLMHKNVTNFLSSMQQQPGLSQEDTLLAVTTISFDIAVLELYLPLTVGAKVLLANREEASDGHLMRAKLQASETTVMQATPATWRMLLAAGWEGKAGLNCESAGERAGEQAKRQGQRQGLKMLCGGEALPRELASQLLERGDSLWNMYGPTETTVWSSTLVVKASALQRSTTSGSLSIGRPIANTQLYILDEHLQPVPIGVTGTLYIGGDGVSRGYLNRPYLTIQKFIPNPFSHNSLLYNTGDMARYLPNGKIEFLGRCDHQVKIRGYRIELGEIEARLDQHPAVRECVVIAREEQGLRDTCPAKSEKEEGDKRLVAYFVPTDADVPTTREWQEFFSVKLPNYMVPSVFVALDALPLTPNGKVNRLALPAPAAAAERTTEQEEGSSVASGPSNPIEQQIAAIWAEVLKLPVVGMNQDFFELGGHSLLATQVLTRLRERFQVELLLRHLFEAPTISQLARRVEALQWASQKSAVIVTEEQEEEEREQFVL